MYACINVVMKSMHFQQILNLLGVNKHYGYMVMAIVSLSATGQAITKNVLG